MTPDDLALLIGIGVIAGAWNAVAGGATLFSFPALMAVGLPPVVANATNFVGVFPANLAALPAYRRELRVLAPALWRLTFLSSAGAAVGSALLLVSDPALFRALIPYLLLAATLLFAFGDRVRAVMVRALGTEGQHRAVYALVFFTSIYGGYFGAGLSIVLLALAQILGYRDFHLANALKNFVSTAFTLISIIIVGLGGLIAWPAALAMMAGAMAGGFLGAVYVRRVNQRLLRIAVTCFGFVLSALYLVGSLGL
ncbi:MAG: sulfite exporter TauE/SafE family protein [Pseudomonadota bacterium]